MVCLRDCKLRVTGPEEVATLLQDLLAKEDRIDQDKEHFYAVHLDTRNRVTLVEVVAIGTLNASLVHPRETFRRAIVEGAASLIVAHNHPSGDTEPSAEDLSTGRRLVEAGRLLDIAVLDHLIFTADGYTSLKETGQL
jgi:DNA repair protein RadC